MGPHPPPPPPNSRSIFMRIFERWYILWLVLKLEISYRINNILNDFGFFSRIFWRLYFCMVKYLSFHNSSFALKYFFNVNGKAKVWHTLCFVCVSSNVAIILWVLWWSTKWGYPREWGHALDIYLELYNEKHWIQGKLFNWKDGWMNGLLLKPFIGWVMCVCISYVAILSMFCQAKNVCVCVCVCVCFLCCNFLWCFVKPNVCTQ